MMATVSAFTQARRRKPATYGKASRSVSAWNTSLDSLDELDTPVQKVPATVAAKSVQEIYPVQKQEAKPQAPKLTKPRTKKQDAWEVPSSDDEDASFVKRKSPPKVLNSRKLVSRVQEKEPELAPWEKKQTAEAQQPIRGTTQRRKQYGVTTAEDQLMSDLVRSLQEDTVLPVALEAATDASMNAPPAASTGSPQPTGAAARLQARKPLAGGIARSNVATASTSSNQKRLGDEVDVPGGTRHKRLRTGSPEHTQDVDMTMDEAPPIQCYSQQSAMVQPPNEVDIYDFPESSADELNTARTVISPRKPVQKRARRGKLTTFSSPRKMECAPVRLSEMLPTDTDTTDTTTRSPSLVPSRPLTPQKSSSASKAPTPETAVRRSAAMTPKQAQLWNRLLTSDTTEASPSALPMKNLTLNSRRSTKVASAQLKPMVRSATDVGRRRTKLVDRLKASAPSSDDETSDGDESTEDVDMDSSDAVEEPTASQSQSQSQTQSQNSYGGKAGPKFTYARTRSYLPEDSFEDQLLLDFPGSTPQRPAATLRRENSKPSVASQKSTYDMEDSEDEDDAGRMRTIHELRAGGGNQRFLDSLGGLLEDIADHNVSARSRRRSALMELANKLVETAFLEKFFRHGYERHILAECSAAPDIIADFTLAAIFVSMVTGEPPDHIVQTLKDGEVLSWLSCLVSHTADPKKLARDRSNNMSKSAQTSFVQFADGFAGQDKIWTSGKPSMLTPRTLALKAYDLLIRKLRLSGDRSELVDVDALGQIAPTEEELAASQSREALVDVSASTSALESLSTIALSLAWPSDVVERVRNLLVSLRTGDDKAYQHLHFLTLRLSLNLTNDNARNCEVFSQQATILRLLQAISHGFATLSADDELDEEQRTINLDLLVLSVGVMTNLAEHNKTAAGLTAIAEAQALLSSIADQFQQGQKRLIEAESVEQGVNNVAYGYLSVMLADLCRNSRAKDIIASRLPGSKLNALVDAMEEFVRHHESVDKLNFAGEEGSAVWSAFTEKLRGVLGRLKTEAEKME